MFATKPIDVMSDDNEWTCSYRFEPFLNKWFVANPAIAGTLGLLNTDQVYPQVVEAAHKDVSSWPVQAYRSPLKLQIQLNTNCNYHCPICYALSERGKPEKSGPTLDELEYLFAYLKAWGVMCVNFVGGEVFMRQDFPDIVAAASKERLLVSCITNGRLPGTKIETYRPLLQSLWNAQVSCNGVGRSYEEEYDTASWDKAKDCILKVLAATRRNILSFVITAKNVQDIPLFLSFAAEARPTIVKFGTVCWSGRSLNDGGRDYYQNVVPAAKQYIAEGRLRFPNLQIQCQVDSGTGTPMWEEYANGYRPFEFYFSPESRDGLYMSAGGELFPFPLLSDRQEFRLGNFREHDMRAIWERHPTLQRLRQVSFESSDCGRVSCKKVCGLWSRSYAISWSGRLDGKVPCETTNWR